MWITGDYRVSTRQNRPFSDAMKMLAPEIHRLRIVHQTGERDYKAVLEAYGATGIEAEVAPFISGMAERFAEADLIVCRSGAITVSGVAAAGRAAIFIPFGAATGSHRRRHAEELV